MSNIFEDFNFNIENYLINKNSVEGLNNVSNYLNFAIKATIIKQIPNCDLNTQCSKGKEILIEYLNGASNSFTRTANIRSNMTTIDKTIINDLLIKTAIEKENYDRNINHLLNGDENFRLCKTITEEIYNGNYETIYKVISTNQNILNTLINNYFSLNYSLDNIKKDRLNLMYNNDSITSDALNRLNIEMRLREQKQK